MADTNKIWLDKQNRVLVNSFGDPYYTTECCCLGVCWQRFEASCMDGDGNPVYGDSGTGISDDMWWTTPHMVAWTCLATSTEELGALDRWVQDSPGTAHIWKSAGINCNSNVCSVPIEDVERPDIPCSCSFVWGDLEVELPHWDYSAPLYTFTGWRYTFDPTTSEITGSESIADAVRPIWDSAGFNIANIYDKVTVEYVSCRQGRYYVANYQEFTLGMAQGICPPDSDLENSRWSAARSTYSYYSAGGENYYSVPSQDVWVPADCTSTSNLFISGGTLYAAMQDYEDFDPETEEYTSYEGLAYIPLAYSVEQRSSTYVMSLLHPVAAEFAYDQWGHLEGSARADNPYISINYAWEGRGASCAKQDVPVSKGILNGWFMLKGSPLWHYRLFITTDFPLENFNRLYKDWAIGGSIPPIEASDTAIIDGLLCPLYWFQQVGVEWGFCPYDPLGEGPLAYAPGLGTGEGGSSVLPDTCWQKFTATCDEGAGVWSEPVLVTWACLPPDTNLLGKTEIWIETVPGYAYIWHNAGVDCISSSCGAVTASIGKPALPCGSVGQGVPGIRNRICQPVLVEEVISANVFRMPNPDLWYTIEGHDYPLHDTLTWVHEVDDAVDEYGDPLSVIPFRAYNKATDGHAYMVIRLNIDNFPTWFMDNQCAEALDGAQPEVAHPGYLESDMTCEVCQSPVNTSCIWPQTPRSMVEIENSCGYRSVYGPVSAIPYPDKRTVGYDADCMALYVVCNITDLIDTVSNFSYWVEDPEDPFGGSYVYRFWKDTHVNLDNWYRTGGGCPDWRWGVAVYCAWSIMDSCIVYQSGSSKWVPTNNSEDYDVHLVYPTVAGVYMVAGELCHGGYINHAAWDCFGWEGRVFNRSDMCPLDTGVHPDYPRIPFNYMPYDDIGYSGTEYCYSYGDHIYSASVIHAGAVILQHPHFYCNAEGIMTSFPLDPTYEPDFFSCLSQLAADAAFPELDGRDLDNEYHSNTITLKSGTVIVYSVAFAEQLYAGFNYASSSAGSSTHAHKAGECFFPNCAYVRSIAEHLDLNSGVSVWGSTLFSFTLSSDIVLEGEDSYVLCNDCVVSYSIAENNELLYVRNSDYVCDYHTSLTQSVNFNSPASNAGMMSSTMQCVIYRVKNIRNSYCFRVDPPGMPIGAGIPDHPGYEEEEGLISGWVQPVQMCSRAVLSRYLRCWSDHELNVISSGWQSTGGSDSGVFRSCGGWETVWPVVSIPADKYTYEYDGRELDPGLYCRSNLDDIVCTDYLFCSEDRQDLAAYAWCSNAFGGSYSPDMFTDMLMGGNASRYVAYSIIPPT